MTQSKTFAFHEIAVQVDQIYKDLDTNSRFALSQYLFALSGQVNVHAQGNYPSLFKQCKTQSPSPQETKPLLSSHTNNQHQQPTTKPIQNVKTGECG